MAFMGEVEMEIPHREEGPKSAYRAAQGGGGPKLIVDKIVNKLTIGKVAIMQEVCIFAKH